MKISVVITGTQHVGWGMHKTSLRLRCAISSFYSTLTNPLDLSQEFFICMNKHFPVVHIHFNSSDFLYVYCMKMKGLNSGVMK